MKNALHDERFRGAHGYFIEMCTSTSFYSEQLLIEKS